MRHVVLLGPQSERPTLAETCRGLEQSGALTAGAPLATVTAGWQEREGERELLDRGLTRPTIDLGLYARAETLVTDDPELARAHRATQERLKTLRRAYNVRLEALISAHRHLVELTEASEVLEDEREAALAALRDLDARHLARVDEIRVEYEAEYRPLERAAVAGRREQIETLLSDAQVVAIAGGHIATLLNRLRLFGVRDLLGGRVVIAWSAGAMAVARRVVLFHDRPPWGPGNAEVFDRGLGLVSGIVAFPHATARLALNDRERTTRLARRFAPDVCTLLDPGARVEWRDGRWRGSGGVQRLDRAGRRSRFRAAAA